MGRLGALNMGLWKSVLCALVVQHPLNMGVAPWLVLGCGHEEAGSAQRGALASRQR